MRDRYLLLFLVFFLLSTSCRLLASDKKVGIGLKTGVSKLEGDWKEPSLSFGGALEAFYSPHPYWAVGGELGLAGLRTGSSADLLNIHSALTSTSDFNTLAVPFEIDIRLYPFPFAEFRPFAELGVGGLWFNTTYDGSTLTIDGHEQKMLDTVWKIGAGVEYPLNPRISVIVGADFRSTLTDRLDQVKSGDENDGMITIWAGAQYYFPLLDRQDLDHDNVPQMLDIDPIYPEDSNGYQDHDGRPENGVPENYDYKKPLVKHYPIFIAKEGSDIEIDAEIYSTTPLKSANVMYRSKGEKKWQILRMEPFQNNIYSCNIPREHVQAEGLEYLVVAVTQDLKGMGYSGLPKRPIQVKVVSNASKWRLATSIASAIGWSSALFLILRKQNN